MAKTKSILLFFLSAFLIWNASSLQAQKKEAVRFFTVGQKAMSEGENEKALTSFQKAEELFIKQQEFSNAMEVIEKTGYLYLNMRQSEKAIESYLDLIKIATKQNDHSRRLTAVDAISTIYLLKGPMQKAIPYIRESISLSKKINEPQIHAAKVIALGNAYFNLGNIDSANYYLHEGLKWSQKLTNNKTVALAKNYLGVFYHSLGNFERAKDNFFGALEIYGSAKDSLNYAASLRQIANLFLHMGDLDHAEEYGQKSYNLSKSLNLKIYRANSLVILADVHEKKGEYQKALSENLEIADIYRTSKNTGQLISTLLRIGHIHMDLNQEQAAEPFIAEAKHLSEKSLNKDRQLSSSISYGQLLLKKGDPKGALEFLLKGAELATDKSQNVKLMRASELLSDTYEKLGQHKEALKWHQNYAILQDSILKSERQKAIYELDTRYQVDQKEKRIALLQTQGDNKELKLTLAKRRQSVMGIGLAIIAAFAGLIFLFYQSKQRDNELLSDQNGIISSALKDKELLLREIQHRVKNNLQVISSLLSIQSYQSEDPDIQDAVREGKDRVKSMSLIHESLYQDQSILAVDAEQYIEKLAQRLFDSYRIDQDKISLNTDIQALKLDVDIMIPLGLILNELVSNSLKYAFNDGRDGNIDISFNQGSDHLSLSVKDDGIGMPDKFNYDNIQSTGFLIIKDFCSKLKGNLSIHSNNGTEILLQIPYK